MTTKQTKATSSHWGAFKVTTENDRIVAVSPFEADETDGQPKAPEWASQICGVTPDNIRDLAHKMAAKRTLITVAWSLQRAQNGEQPYWMAATLAAMLGQIGLPGGGIGYGYGANQQSQV